MLIPEDYDPARRYAGPWRRDVETLLEWAARDNDRSTLFAAELEIDV